MARTKSLYELKAEGLKKKNKNACDPAAKMDHCINKKMEWFL
mgnify:CR=1 FL=1